ncbi:hypothetical protein Tco_1211190 [Tanacetum coccineum]
MHNPHNGSGSRDRTTYLQTDDMHNGDHGSYDTLIQDQMVMPYESAFSKVLTLQRLSQHQLKDAIHLIFIGIGDEYILTVDACQKLRNGEPSKGCNKLHAKIQEVPNADKDRRAAIGIVTLCSGKRVDSNVLPAHQICVTNDIQDDQYDVGSDR